MVAAVLGAVLAGWGGLARSGWSWPAGDLPGEHGPLMILGFLGTLIGMERAVSVGARWAYVAPLASVLGGVAWFSSLPDSVAQWFWLVAGLGLVAIFASILRQQPSLHGAVLLLGSLLWMLAVALWLGHWFVFEVSPLLAGSLVVTIAGERLELSRLALPGRAARASFFVCLGVLLAGLLATPWDLDAGVKIAGAGLLLLAAWLGLEDVARRTIRQTGVTRFMAAALLLGYAWLAVGGAAWIWMGGAPAGPERDLGLHAVLVGFVLSMVFAHAPIVLAAVLQVPLTYSPSFWVHLGLLHASMLLRAVGDLIASSSFLRWGGLLTGIAFLVFLTSSAAAAVRARRTPLTTGPASPQS